MNKRKLNEKKSFKEEETTLLLKNFLQRLQRKRITPKELYIIEELKKSYNPEADKKNLTKRELKNAINRNRREILRRIGGHPHSRKQTIRQISIYAGSAAAVIALLFVLFTSPFIKNISRTDSYASLSDLPSIEKQFITDNEMKKIVLADGSTIFLNQGTTISLRKGKFNAHAREIWLDEGEAFFDVKREVNRPFIVHTPNGINTQVLGTSFNIRAYAELEEQIISVNTGRVQVFDKKENLIILDPDHKVSVNKINNQFVPGKTNALNISAWRSGTIVLEQATIKEVAFRLKQAFNIELIYSPAVNENARIVTSFTINTPQEEVLNTICKLYNVKYNRKNNTVELIK